MRGTLKRLEYTVLRQIFFAFVMMIDNSRVEILARGCKKKYFQPGKSNKKGLTKFIISSGETFSCDDTKGNVAHWKRC